MDVGVAAAGNGVDEAVGDAGIGDAVIVPAGTVGVGVNAAIIAVLVGSTWLVDVGATLPIVFPTSVTPVGWFT
jgi:hypothetical protein